jgi:glyoxylase-like metal-dependent hydrolase (beta-lactamase superfamily II)
LKNDPHAATRFNDECFGPFQTFSPYDGRLEGVRAHSDEPNWQDDGAYSLGICSYAIVDGAEALVYDTRLSIAHAEAIRHTLHAMAVRSIRVVLSHWHDDHVAGNEVFADCEMIANASRPRLLPATGRPLRAAIHQSNSAG